MSQDAVVVKLLGCAEQNLHELMQVCGQPDGTSWLFAILQA